MGPWNLKQQQERKRNVASLLSQPGLSSWALDYWSRVYAALAMNEQQYNARVHTVYKGLSRELLK